MLPAGGGRVTPISRKDVAAVIAAVAARPGRAEACHVITGRQALSFAEIAAVYETVFARPMRYRDCSKDDYLGSVCDRLEAPWPLAFASLGAAIAEGRWGSASPDFMDITSRETESFHDFLVWARSPYKNFGVMSIYRGAVRRRDAGPLGPG